jgi:hypothetical protein
VSPRYVEGETVTAHDLAADWAWLEAGLVAVPVRGRKVRWDVAEYIGARIRVGRVASDGAGLRAFASWPSPDAQYRLER